MVDGPPAAAGQPAAQRPDRAARPRRRGDHASLRPGHRGARRVGPGRRPRRPRVGRRPPAAVGAGRVGRPFRRRPARWAGAAGCGERARPARHRPGPGPGDGGGAGTARGGPSGGPGAARQGGGGPERGRVWRHHEGGDGRAGQPGDQPAVGGRLGGRPGRLPLVGGGRPDRGRPHRRPAGHPRVPFRSVDAERQRTGLPAGRLLPRPRPDPAGGQGDAGVRAGRLGP